MGIYRCTYNTSPRKHFVYFERSLSGPWHQCPTNFGQAPYADMWYGWVLTQPLPGMARRFKLCDEVVTVQRSVMQVMVANGCTVQDSSKFAWLGPS